MTLFDHKAFSAEDFQAHDLVIYFHAGAAPEDRDAVAQFLRSNELFDDVTVLP